MIEHTKRPLLPVDDALARILAEVAVMPSETVHLADAHNRILAEDICAKRTQPPFAASAMDGYAVRSADVERAGVRLSVVGEVAAGYVFEGIISQGESVRIFTGAPIPEGADCVLIQENASVVGDAIIEVNEPVAIGTYVRAAGLDFTDGELLLEKGRLLDAGALCLAASGNHSQLQVVRKPRVGILATGDELRVPGSELESGQIIASNSYGVGAICAEKGAEIIDLGIARDNKASLAAALDNAKQANCDVLVTLGGASVGEHDLVQPVFMDAGMTLDFWKIAMRPGKPLMFGMLGDMRILGLPGNPVSSLVCSHLFLSPLLSTLAGRSVDRNRKKAVLLHAMKANGNREQYARAIINRGIDGYEADVFENQDSSVISFYSKANALVVRPIGAPEANSGEVVEFIELRPID